MQIEDLEKIRQKNLKSSVVGNFFFLFFPGGVRKDTSVL